MNADDHKAFAARMEELHATAEAHPGLAATRRWREWGIVVNALRANQRDLIALVEAPSKDERLAVELIQNVRDTSVGDAYIAEMYRLLHNYLASVKSLVDHSRNLMSRYEDSLFHREYETRVKELSRQPVARFVQDLRNVLLHQQLPAISVNLRFNQNEGVQTSEFSSNFESATLLANDRFTRDARRYVEAQDATWPVRLPVDEYGTMVNELCDWCALQFTSQHQGEIAEYNAIVAEIHRLLGPMPSDDEMAARLAAYEAERRNDPATDAQQQDHRVDQPQGPEGQRDA